MISRLLWHAFMLIIYFCYHSESFGLKDFPRSVYPGIRKISASGTNAVVFDYFRGSGTWEHDSSYLEALHSSSCVVAAGLALALMRSARFARCQYGRLKSRKRLRSSLQAVGSPVLLRLEGVAARTSESQKEIIAGVDLTIREGEVHAMMGLNGSGKSTLSRVLAGDSAYEVTNGSASFANNNLFDLDPHERALSGLFLAFQSPPALSGVSNLDFLRAIYNAQRRAKGEPEMDVIEFSGLAAEKLKQLSIPLDYLNRSVNDGFSGGERKRNEMLQMMIMEPKLAILDEIDSGLDIDALKDVAKRIAHIRNMDGKRSMLLITHFERFLKYVDADFVHIMHQGKIVRSGGKELATQLDEEGYDRILAGL